MLYRFVTLTVPTRYTAKNELVNYFVASKFICLLQVGAICLQYSHDDVGQPNIQELKLQYSCIGGCIYATADT